MLEQNKLTTINLYDKLNAAFVGLITPEMSGLNKIRQQNSYSNEPTLEKPYDMPLEVIFVNGIQIRFAKSIVDLKKKKKKKP